MASLTEILAAQANPKVNTAENLSAGAKAGIGLATAAEQVQSAKQQVEAQKADLIVKQASTANSLLTNLARANPMIAKKMLPQVKEKLLNLGVDPTVAEYTVSDDANRKRQIAFSQMATGKIPQDPKFASEYFQSLADVVGYDQAAQQFDLAQKRSQEDQKMAQQNEQFYAGLASQERMAATKKPGASMGLTKGDEKRDTEYAKEYSSFFDQGGASRIESNLNLLEPVIADLEKEKTSKYSGLLGDTVQNIIDPKTAETKTNITSVLIQSLKDTFGGQLSDGERKSMVDSVYKDTADPKANAKRVQEMIDKIKAGAAAKQAAGEYFEENGTLKGFKGTQSFNIGGRTVKVSPTEKTEASSPGSQPSQAGVDTEIEAKLKTLPPGADINLARAALVKAKANLSAGK
jgi:hypothetical protein